MRFLDWGKTTFISRSVKQDVIEHMFAYLNRHSHSYFQNNFAGSLANKITDMAGGIVAVVNVIDDAFAQTMGLLIAVIAMFIVHPLFASVLLGWAVMFIGIAVYFAGSIHHLSHVFATSKTTLVGENCR